MKPAFKRILLKLSGEGLTGESKTGIDVCVVKKLAAQIAEVKKSGVEVCVVVGGGNFFRGAKNAGGLMDRSVADQIGMMATVMNALALKAALDEAGCETEIFSGLNVPQVCEAYSFRKAMAALENGKTLIFAAGTGSPYFTTDTGAALRAIEMHCDILLKATQVDGVYDADPRIVSGAKRYETISYDEVIAKQLKIMDLTAIAMAKEAKLPIMIFAQAQADGLMAAVCGRVKHTIIKQTEV